MQVCCQLTIRAIDRIKIRVEKGGHFIPDKDVIRRFYRSKNNFYNIYRKLADEWSIHYNSNKKLIGVATGCKSKEEVMDEDLYKMFIKDIKK